MNEIERAISVVEDTFEESLELKNEARADACKTALRILTAELSRQGNALLTCDGCANLPTKYGSGVYMNAPCRICVRGITTRDYYKSAVEPKGEHHD